MDEWVGEWLDELTHGTKEGGWGDGWVERGG